MKKIINAFSILWKKRLMLVLIIIFSFLAGFFVSDRINYFNSKYECSFITQEVINCNELLSKAHLEEVKQSAEKYSNINIDELISKEGIYLVNNSDNNYSIVTYSRYYENFFIKSSSTVSTRAKMFIKDIIITYYDEDEISFTYGKDIIKTKDHINDYLIGSLTLLVALVISIPLIFIKHNSNTKNEDFYDNTNIYSSIFHKQYWIDASKFLSSPKKITSLAMLFALLLISKAVTLPTGFGNLGLSFGFIFFSLICLINGPLCGLLIGCLSDILGYFLFDSTGTAFFIGYVFQAMLTGFIYGIFFYKTKLTYLKVLLARLTIGLVCNVLIGSFCWGFVAGYNLEQTWSYLLFLSLPKNLVYLIPQSIVLFLIFKALSPALSSFQFIDEKIAKNISLI